MARQRQTLKSSLEAHDRIPHMQDVRLLKDYVRAMWDAARKRINRLNDPTVVGANRTYGAFVANQFGPAASSASNDPVTLRDEYRRLYQFLTSETSTPAGYKKWYDRQEAIWGIQGMTPQQLSDFWDAYNKAVRAAHLTPQSYDSKQLVRALGARITSTGAQPLAAANSIMSFVRTQNMRGIRSNYDDIMRHFGDEED